jgi:predicted LPLAT superfamily acyltransferase
MATRVIEISGLDSMLRVKELVERGELVALLGDRADLNGKFAMADFLGAPARFPTGLYILAGMLRCPVFLTVGLYKSPNRYDFFCEPFLDIVDLPRKGRDEAIRRHVQRYASRLEEYCRRAPENWFNFYDFWSAPPTPEQPS